MASANKPKQTVSGILIVLALLPQVAEADNRHQRPLATISIIIDDMGNALHDGRRAIALPGQITYSFLPHTPYSRELAQLARRNHKEIMLHVPMQSIDGEHPLGHGALTLD